MLSPIPFKHILQHSPLTEYASLFPPPSPFLSLILLHIFLNPFSSRESPTMGSCFSLSLPKDIFGKKKAKSLPIETIFKLPSPIPSWPPGGGFASGIIDLGGGLKVCQTSSFNKIWATQEGGPDNNGATFFEPTQLPNGFYMLGSYAQPNNKALFGWVLGARSEPDPSALQKPVDYTLVWSSESLKIKQDGPGYIWLPTPPDGYKAVGHVVTVTATKPSLDKIRCVRSDLTDQCQTDTWIWGQNNNGLNVYGLRPSSRGIQAQGVSVGTFIAQVNGTSSPLSISCLKNVNATSSLSYMPSLSQLDALVQAYSPFIYLHPDEQFLPSSVNWYFANGALLYKKGNETNPTPIEPNGSNLPQDGLNDDMYWLDLPTNESAKDKVRKGDLQTAEAYLHIKPMLGATFTDIVVWIFYPFNGPGKAKIGILNNVALGRIGEHVGDWEHVTLRVSNFNGELWSVYFSAHSGGRWADASELEFHSNGSNGNKVVSYASLNGHASYPHPGLVLRGNGSVGIRDDAAKSNKVMDTGARFSVIAADYLGVESAPWVNYGRKWGPKITYDLDAEIKKVEKALPGLLKSEFEKLVRSLPNEILGEEGPTGPKMKKNWNNDEV